MTAAALGLSYGSRPVLDDVSLAISRGEFVALVGPNGAGKSTLLSVLAGDSAAEGALELDGRPLRSYRALELARLRSVLTQSNEVSFPFTVAEVVSMGREPRRAEGDSDAVERALADAEVTHLRERRMPELSGGERARVAYARVRAQGCDLVLLDEPTASLDIRHQERLLGQVRAHTSAGGSAVVVLHDLGLAAAYADRVVVLERGHVRADGSPATALTTELLSSVYRHPIRVTLDADGALSIRPDRTTPWESR